MSVSEPNYATGLKHRLSYHYLLGYYHGSSENRKGAVYGDVLVKDPAGASLPSRAHLDNMRARLDYHYLSTRNSIRALKRNGVDLPSTF